MLNSFIFLNTISQRHLFEPWKEILLTKAMGRDGMEKVEIESREK